MITQSIQPMTDRTHHDNYKIWCIVVASQINIYVFRHTSLQNVREYRVRLIFTSRKPAIGSNEDTNANINAYIGISYLYAYILYEEAFLKENGNGRNIDQYLVVI